MQLELVLRLRAHRHHAGIVRSRTYFGKPNIVALDEQLDAEDASATEVSRDSNGDFMRLRECNVRHSLRLPRLHVIAVDLHMPDRLAEVRLDRTVRSNRPYGEQRDFIIEGDIFFGDHFAAMHASRALGILPRSRHVRLGTNDRLSLAGR